MSSKSFGYGMHLGRAQGIASGKTAGRIEGAVIVALVGTAIVYRKEIKKFFIKWFG